MPWSVAFMVVAIVLVVTMGRVARERARAMRLRAESDAPTADAVAAREDVRKLKERIAVLERVVTDNHGSIGLDREIEQLRDR